VRQAPLGLPDAIRPLLGLPPFRDSCLLAEGESRRRLECNRENIASQRQWDRTGALEASSTADTDSPPTTYTLSDVDMAWGRRLSTREAGLDKLNPPVSI
jgi:hypothetical protein